MALPIPYPRLRGAEAPPRPPGGWPPMTVLLVNMPWAALEVPSLALGLLRRRVETALPEADVSVMYANLAFMDWIAAHCGIEVPDYVYLAQTTYFVGVGDWIFSSALYQDPQWREAEFRRDRHAALSADRMSQALALHRAVPRFVDELAERIVASGAQIVGFTSTFQQNVAALAAARAVKRLAPHVRTVFGGANCDGPQGAALHRNFPFVDFVCRGEGEETFVALLRAIPTGGGFGEVAGLCWRDADGASVVNPMAAQPLPPAAMVTPDYADYFAQLAASTAAGRVEPKLVVEGSRGCWWGAKHHCTFCGLNGSSMAFRSKPGERFKDELLELVSRYRVLDVFVVDNILDLAYFSSFLPGVATADLDLRLQYEIKSNVRRDQLELLARAGVSTVQPGIENLSTAVLRLMRKGVSGCQNVRMLRDAESVGLSVAWNLLYGFPGESPGDYADIVAQLPALHHLHPPEWSGRIAIERFSPYFEDSALGFPDREPDIQYRLAYDLPVSELEDLAYLFHAPPRGIDEHVASVVDGAIAEWQRAYAASRLCYYDHGDAIVLVNRRPSFPWTARRLTEPAELSAFRALDQPRTAQSLARAVAAGGAVGFDEAAAEGLLGKWRELGLVFAESGRFVQLATEGHNQDLFHLDCDGQFLGQVDGTR